MTITITLPLPPKELSPNKPTMTIRGRMAKNRATKKYRNAAMLAVLSQVAGWKPRWKTATIQVEYFFKTAAFRDADNCLASLKAAFDGLTDAGLLDDDRGVTHLPVKRSKDALNPRVVICVHPVYHDQTYESAMRICDQKQKTIEILRNQLSRICEEGFGNEDTIGGESADDYVLRQIAKLKKSNL